MGRLTGEGRSKVHHFAADVGRLVGEERRDDLHLTPLQTADASSKLSSWKVVFPPALVRMIAGTLPRT